MADDLVFPGDRITIEEEGSPGRLAYAEDGNVYSLVVGKAKVEQGTADVEYVKDVERFRRGMTAVGEITDDLHAVMFVKINPLTKNGVTYVALKSGKILVSERRDHDRHSFREREERLRGKPFRLGDIVMGRIVGEDKDIYSMSVHDPESGVVYAECELCSGALKVSDIAGTLKCERCEHEEYRKISPYYGDFKKIEMKLG